VPVVPGATPADQTDAGIRAAALAIGLPVVVKASAGGGGKGMRIVPSAAEFAQALEGAQREAQAAFGDPTVFIERYVQNPRHIEIQILGDHHGNLIHLWERECSIQRRHQKVIEEAPSPALDDARRSSMGAAAVALGRAVGYTSAGTVEFIVAPDGSFYFLEVNTRLQVEHPVTEAITGLDLVREQIRIARGEALTIAAAPPINGHAIEVRLYAEDADNGYLPTTGRIADWHLPASAGLRVDAGVQTGTEIGIHYDPMLAKVIAHAPTRREAAQLLRSALERGVVAGVITNRRFLARVLAHPEFLSGELDTHFLDRHADVIRAAAPSDADLALALAAATLAGIASRRAAPHPLPALEPGYRNVRFADSRLHFALGDRALDLSYRNLGADRFIITTLGAARTVRLLSWSPTAVSLVDEHGVRRTLRITALGPRWQISWPGTELTLVESPRFPELGAEAVAGGCVAPMPGKVVKVLVSVGDAVTQGQTLLILEAMKMEHSVRALTAGTLSRLSVSPGDQVDTGALLAIIT
jgi:acetyl/propionyl-CoA carboxylase alpha subunit